MGRPKGSKNKNSKSLAERFWESGNYTQGQLGKMFGVSGATVSPIVNRKSWSWLD